MFLGSLAFYIISIYIKRNKKTSTKSERQNNLCIYVCMTQHKPQLYSDSPTQLFHSQLYQDVYGDHLKIGKKSYHNKITCNEPFVSYSHNFRTILSWALDGITEVISKLKVNIVQFAGHCGWSKMFNLAYVYLLIMTFRTAGDDKTHFFSLSAL